MGQGKRQVRSLIILIVVLAALAVAIAYNIQSAREESIEPQSAKVFDFPVTWRCLECGHTLSDKGAAGVRKCPNCGAEAMYISSDWQCRRHGTFPVAFQYNEKGRPVRMKLDANDWQPAFDQDGIWQLRCPECGGGMQPPGGMAEQAQ